VTADAAPLVHAQFDVVGTPIPQGSMRAFRRPGGGYPIMTADNPRTRPWKDAVTWAASELHVITLAGPALVRIDFRLARPKGHTGKRGLLPSAPAHPETKPDIDKLARAVLDSLVEAQLLRDDALVAELRVRKRYVVDGEMPGANVKVWAL
jgi:Holliday junction resolvase RusA-like endonuclease